MRSRLKEAGLKATKQRVALLEELNRQDKAMTADELFEALHPTTGMDRSTVYRNLSVLEEHHLVERVDLRGEEGACYCLACREHCHRLVCVGCHRTVPIPGCPLHSMEQSIRESTGFEILGHTLEMTGLCPECAAKKIKSKK